MADPCHRRSCSLGSTQCSHSNFSVQNSQNISNRGNPRCTCPHPGCPPSGRASVQASHLVRHPSFTSHCTNFPHAIYEYPLRSSYAPSYLSRPSLPHFHPAPHYPPYRGFYGGFPDPRRRAPSAPPSSMPSIYSQQSYYAPKYHCAKLFYPGYDDRNPENAMRPVYHLRAYPKQRSQLYVAEYEHLEHLHSFPITQAEWTLPSFKPFYSVVYLRNCLLEPICCDSFRNVCVATIGGRGIASQSRSNQPITSSLCDGYCSRCGVYHSEEITECCDRPGTSFERFQNIIPIRVSSAPSPTRSRSSYSEPLTLENDVYTTRTAMNSSSTSYARRRPYTPETTTCSTCGHLHFSDDSFSTTSPSVVRWTTTEKRQRYCPRHGFTDTSVVSTSYTDGSSISSGLWERQAIDELQKLQNILGLKCTKIDRAPLSYDSECLTCDSFDLFSNASTANPICQCRECVKTKGLGTKVEPSKANQAYVGEQEIVCVSCSPCSHTMVSVPSISGNTAQQIQAPPSPSDAEYVSAVAQPNELSSTVSGPREDSRSGGRDVRRPLVRSLCDKVEEHDCNTASVSTAQPIYDPSCSQCAEDRFADRLRESLDESCTCVPVLRVDSGGSISLINTTVVTPKDTVMDKRHKRSLVRYIEKATGGGARARDAVIHWVRSNYLFQNSKTLEES
ncbi:unnamed protein product [Cylicocyclus nassatus]|uniref:Uncharacterized protein n=1 Tax=Cylicocyclus nassatus TaxID=53992 RepID=A0AA36H3A4_CYLNA|nr:unnamed protein product [Cylicocyclus nassatus]